MPAEPCALTSEVPVGEKIKNTDVLSSLPSVVKSTSRALMRHNVKSHVLSWVIFNFFT